jgi:hypothetical protein
MRNNKRAIYTFVISEGYFGMIKIISEGLRFKAGPEIFLTRC